MNTSHITTLADARSLVADLKANRIALPDGVEAADLVAPSYGKWNDKLGKPVGGTSDDFARGADGYGYETFELWYTEAFGWCIPTLLIAKVSSRRAMRGQTNERTYATDIRRGGQVRIGFGPHVKARVTVYVRKERVATLQRFLDLRAKGTVDANTTRDRISSRRAEGAQRRAEGRTSWRWSF